MPGRFGWEASGAQGIRWRKAQRMRTRRMTRRGRLSIAAAVGLALILASWIGQRSFVASDSEPARGEVPPRVASAPPDPPLQSPPRQLIERLPVSRAALDLRVSGAGGVDLGRVSEKGVNGRLYETVPVGGPDGGWASPLRVEYTLDAELTRGVFRSLERGRVGLGNVILLDPDTGRVLAYASTDLRRFPPTRSYPAASLVKVITAAAALDTALATSNNQCFAQLAVHAIGQRPMMEAISRFGWLDAPAPAHAAGSADPGEDRYAFGKLGCGLSGCRITPLHAAQLAATLANGELVAPRWIERIVDARGRELPLSDSIAPRRVVSPEIAAELREMLVETTRSGTARRAFRKRNGAPLLGSVEVAGKTGSLSGKNPRGRYEWFIGAAPAADPRIAIAVVVVQGDLYWQTASQIAADVLRVVFCSDGPCRASDAARWTFEPDKATAARPDGSTSRLN